MCPISQCDNRTTRLTRRNIDFLKNCPPIHAYNYFSFEYYFIADYSIRQKSEQRVETPSISLRLYTMGSNDKKNVCLTKSLKYFIYPLFKHELRRKCILSIILYILFNQFKILSWKCVLWAILRHRKLITFITIAIKLWYI